MAHRIVDAQGTAGLLGHVEGRTAALVTQWITEQPQAWRDGVSHVTIDLSASYAKAVADALPGAVLVADRFHLVALANTALTDVRQRVTREALGRRGRKVDPQWGQPTPVGDRPRDTVRGLVHPTSQTPRPQRLRLPQRHQSPPSHTLGLHPPTPAGHSQNHPVARSSLKSRSADPLTLPHGEGLG